MPGAHFIKHDHRSVNRSKIITPDGHPVELEANNPDAPPDGQGTAYMGQYRGARVFEPLVLYHYVERGTSEVKISKGRALLTPRSFRPRSKLDAKHIRFRTLIDVASAQDCLRKLKVAQKLRKGGWRDQAGEDGCKE